jgi:hypothetical protein
MASTPELSTLLRDGRMVAAEVLTRPGDGTVMLAIGRHVVPAETELRFEPGTRFLLRVEDGPEGLVLRLLGGEGDEEPGLLRALRRVVGQGRPLGELLGDLHVALVAQGPAGAALARGLAQHAALPGGGALLASLLLGSGLAHESLLAAAVQGGPGGAGSGALAAAGSDLKAWLLRALQDLPEGPAREAARQALAGLEAEQLLNLARERMGEPLVFALPFLDGEAWTTARFQVPPRERGAEGEEEAASFRMAVGLELSRLGPVRADLALTPTALVVRVLVTRADLARRLGAQAKELAARLGDGHRRVQLHVRLDAPERVRLNPRPLDIRFLQEHRLLSVDG